MKASDSYDLQTDTNSPVVLMLTQLVCPLVDCPDHVRVFGVGSGKDIEFVVELDSADLEKFCGATRTAQSLRVIVRAIGTKDQRNFSLSFADRPFIAAVNLKA